MSEERIGDKFLQILYEKTVNNGIESIDRDEIGKEIGLRDVQMHIKFNIIGFGWQREPRKDLQMTCDVHYATILIPKKDQPGFLQCRECGASYEDPDYQGQAEALATEIDEMIKRNRHIVRK